MKKIEAEGSRTWAHLEKASHKDVCLALENFEPFMKHIVDRIGYSRNNKNPVLQLLCPRGHPIIKVQLHMDAPKWISLGHSEMDLHQAGEESENYVPASQVLIHDTERAWGVDEDSRYVWQCAYHEEDDDSLDGCGTAIEWGGIFCDEHQGAPEPDALNMLWENRVKVRCPQCRYDGTHRRSSLLIDYAIAVTTHRRSLRLRS